MRDERGTAGVEHDEELPSVKQIAGLDAYLDRLVGDRRRPEPSPHAAALIERQIAAQLRLAPEGVERPTPAFLQALESRVGRAVAQETRRGRGPGISRMGFLRTAATVAGGAGLGVAVIEGVGLVQDTQGPHGLVAAGNDHWYDIAASEEVQPGGAKRFTAGGVLGYLLNDNGNLHAVSAICTHRGCTLKPDVTAGQETLLCLCHGARFSRRGTVLHGMARSPLPAIALRVEHGRVYARGTHETV